MYCELGLHMYINDCVWEQCLCAYVRLCHDLYMYVYIHFVSVKYSQVQHIVMCGHVWAWHGVDMEVTEVK